MGSAGTGVLPRLFAHRGGSALAPENTLVAFENGLRLGADRLELDVHATSDGTVVVLHDPTLDRTTDGSGEVRRTSLAELLRLDAGHRFVDVAGEPSFRGRGVRVPTFAEVLRAFPDTPLNVEIKQHDPEIVGAVLDEMDRAGARDRVLLAAEAPAIMARIRELAPDVATSSSVADVLDFFERMETGRLAGHRPPGVALQIPPSWEGRELVTVDSVRAAHEIGLEVHVWTIDEAAEIERLLRIGVDGIVTDRPDVARRVYESLGMR
ncbi:MAG: glycerophosphodiester phosphodiesterase [Alphaproteobacteria bacterium]